MSEDSFNKRYLFKLLTNLFGFVINLITQAIVPRALGPKSYGDFGFISGFFTQFVGFFDMGTSVCFYTKLSGKPDDLGLVRFYGYFVLGISAITLAFVIITHSLDLHRFVWPDQQIRYIYLAAVWGVLVWIIGILTMMGDAYGLTVAAEKARMLQRVLGLVLLLALFIFGQLHLTQFFLYHFLVLCFMAGAFVFILETKGYSLRGIWIFPSRIQLRTYVKEFYLYSHPLFWVSLLALISGIFDRWILQVAGGSVQQGFYSLSYQIGAMCFLFTGAMTPLLLREFSIAHTNRDIGQMTALFRRYFPVLYSVSAFFSCYIALQADKVIHLFGGSPYRGAMAAVVIMAFYPIHQTYGQLTASLFYATGQTALYRNIGFLFLMLGLPLTYLLIAPQDKLGLNAGATGLAAKMVVVNIIAVNVQLYFNARQLHLRFWRYVGHQIISVAVLLGIAYVSVILMDHILFSGGAVIANFMLSGCIYTLLVSCLILLFPPIFGITHADLASVFQKIAFATGWRTR